MSLGYSYGRSELPVAAEVNPGEYPSPSRQPAIQVISDSELGSERKKNRKQGHPTLALLL